MAYPVNVRLLCGNAIVREGLSRILMERDFRVAQYPNMAAALQRTEVLEEDTGPSLLLIDHATEELDSESISALQRRFPSSYLVLLSDRFDFQIMLKAFRLGALGYIVKEIACDRLIATLRLVAMGERVLPPQLADELQSRPSLSEPLEIERPVDATCLSDREMEILRWLIMGCPNKVISKRMNISEATVKVHVKAVLRKLRVKNRTQAAIWAANHGMRGGVVEAAPEVPADVTIPHPAQLPALERAASYSHV
ncbi:LuxR C-terminal-related transcriptional regulator [Sphingobium bisphenolivorans]|uniref:LuxR C-terminal-related transcriptional regulator n=1 Tax=Sphingobium bisphenolivorans TaxID=1335760 RepID=UPI0003B5F07F|nr:response regulator transcription factor [Sphingobium bisphenolivorans]